ncbi:hypothetical protein [Burkholderia ubonensis]|uniref:hypothetical protein n=1 Tax=Burkholderia ubonensis TaxID=101571 RepID=UPI000F56D807|nr:hypothetical protein [Burkholderia ubonensis]
MRGGAFPRIVKMIPKSNPAMCLFHAVICSINQMAIIRKRFSDRHEYPVMQSRDRSFASRERQAQSLAGW